MKAKDAGPVALITGGASGIGYAIAKRFVGENIRCVLVGRNATKLKLACETLGELSDFVAFDLNQLGELPQLVRAIREKTGGINILVNNAGIHVKKPLTEITDDEFQKVVLTNQTAAFSLTREVACIMKKQKGGVVLNISSMASQYGIPYVMPFTASKTALEGMTRAMAVELAEHGIRVNCIAPGFIKTNMSTLALNKDPERKKRVLARTPMKRLGKPSEVAEAALFLVSDASSYITGIVLPVDGGNSIGF